MLADTVLDVVLVVAGVVAIVVAIIWRTGSRRRQITRWSRVLTSTDPGRRVDAAVALTELGLDRSARPLLAHARVEQDPDVRVGIAAAVARRQWEPGGPPGVADLREWAAAELTRHGYNVTTFGPATTRLADMGGPRLPEATPHLPVGSVAPPGATTAVAPSGALPSAALPGATTGSDALPDDAAGGAA